MRVYLQALGDDVYRQIETKYIVPTVEVPLTADVGARTLKPRADYTNAKKCR